MTEPPIRLFHPTSRASNSRTVICAGMVNAKAKLGSTQTESKYRFAARAIINHKQRIEQMTGWQMIAGEGARLKREQLEREIGRLKDPTERSNLEHTFSKLFMFLEDDIHVALRMAANNPYRTR